MFPTQRSQYAGHIPSPTLDEIEVQCEKEMLLNMSGLPDAMETALLALSRDKKYLEDLARRNACVKRAE